VTLEEDRRERRQPIIGRCASSWRLSAWSCALLPKTTSLPREEVRDRIVPFFLSFYQRDNGLGYWAAEGRGTGGFLGWFHLRPTGDGSVDLGYRLRKAAWTKGYATEGSQALIRKCFTDLGVDRVAAHTMAVNHASRRVMEKCGLVFVQVHDSANLPAIPGAEPRNKARSNTL
jgi:RimJ/RimL family protein N-acetyltransferase